jgi:DNA-binding XRE family transcriptional regulator
MNPDSVHVCELPQEIVHNLQILWRAREESPATREGHSWVRGRCERRELLGPSSWARLRAAGWQEPYLGAGPEPLLARIEKTKLGGRVRSERALGRDALAKKAGTSRECVRKLEAGVHDFTVGTFHRLARALGVQ